MADADTIPAALQVALSKRSPNLTWMVLNGGVRAYDTVQELALLEELCERIQPDVVVLCWYWNDLRECDLAATYAKWKDRGEIAFDTGECMSGWPLCKWHLRQMLRRSTLLMLAHDVLTPNAGQLTRSDADLGLQRLPGYLTKLCDLGAACGFDPVFVVLPDANAISGAADALRQEVSDRALLLSRERKLPTVDPASAVAALCQATRRLPVLPFDGHYDGVANWAMAETLAERLLELGVVEQVVPRLR